MGRPCQAEGRPIRGYAMFSVSLPGVPLRFTPGYSRTPLRGDTAPGRTFFIRSRSIREPAEQGEQPVPEDDGADRRRGQAGDQDGPGGDVQAPAGAALRLR